MVQKLRVEGFEAFKAEVSKQSADKGKTIFVLFSGTKDADGKSWCPDCVTAEPLIEDAFSKVSDDSVVYIYVGVGDRAFWKDPKCIFRTDESTKLKSVPTLIKWGTPQRLDEDNCNKKELVDMMILED